MSGWGCARSRPWVAGPPGSAQAEVFDEQGFVGRTAQALLVRLNAQPEPGP